MRTRTRDVTCPVGSTCCAASEPRSMERESANEVTCVDSSMTWDCR
jgi:hypothetical protein